MCTYGHLSKLYYSNDFFFQVAKEDIAVRFYEECNGSITWEGFGDFQQSNVHKQVAISFRTPRFRTLNLDHPVEVR